MILWKHKIIFRLKTQLRKRQNNTKRIKNYYHNGFASLFPQQKVYLQCDQFDVVEVLSLSVTHPLKAAGLPQHKA